MQCTMSHRGLCAPCSRFRRNNVSVNRVTMLTCTKTLYQSLQCRRIRVSSGWMAGDYLAAACALNCYGSDTSLSSLCFIIIRVLYYDKAFSEWCIGSKGGGRARMFLGHIADVQLWSVPLTQAHVMSLVADQGSSTPHPVARWMLDDDGGVVINCRYAVGQCENFFYFF